MNLKANRSGYLLVAFLLAMVTRAAQGGATLPVGVPRADSAIHLTLPQALEEAQAANRGLKALGHRRKAAEHDASALARSRWGELGSAFSYSYLNDDQILRPMSRELIAGGIGSMPFDRSQMHYGVNYRIPLYLGGRLNNQIQIAKLESQKAEALLEGARWQVRFNVISLYTAAQTLDRVLAALDEQLAALAQTKARLDVMVSEGKRPEVDRLKVIEELEGVKARRATTAADRLKVGSFLLSLLGREPTDRLTVDPLPEQAPSLGVGPDELRVALQRNSRIRQAELAAEQSERGIKVARSTFLPKVYAGANYLEHTGAESDRSLETWMAGVTVELPLFAGTSRFQKLHAAREKRAAAREALADTQLRLAAELEDALAKFDAARTNLVSARARIAAAAEAARIEQVRYETGAGTIEDLLRAQAREEGARAALAAAQGELLTAAARINSLVEQEVVK
ncbi:MAG: TolC family protein [Verrucomicrobia bacterium]|nr:MAG: TolC family protein [Verrucomicrobiota bacterium]